jgi:hypothetical protein
MTSDSPPELIITENFRRVLRKKEQRLQDAIRKCISRLIDSPDHPGLQVHRVQGTKTVWEAYVDSANRVTFERPGDGVIVLRNNCNHDIIKRQP